MNVDKRLLFAAEHAHNLNLVNAVVCSGLYPHVAIVEPPLVPGGEPRLTTQSGDVFLHPSTVAFGAQAFPAK